MPKASDVVYYLLHIQELRSIIQWKTWHSPVHDRDESKETETQKICFKYLEKTSRSFAAVIKELHPELLMPVCLFYLILRGLDTVEDDTSISAKTKEPVLRRFHEHLEEDGWCFTENRPEEKDRDLLVNFKYVISEFKTVKPVYKKIIADITDKMGNGMADYCLNAEFNEKGVDKIEDYDLYCYYVAGLVGEGLTRMFVESSFGNPGLMEKPNLMISMGLFLQKTNIIRDIKEDHDDNRRFWPREIWSRYVDDFSDLVKPENREKALHCSSDMVLNALSHADECLFYLAGIREQSVFNFCAIPQGMAIATLALCFRNPAMFERNIKISKGEACQLMIESTQNLQVLCETFKRYTKIIRQKNDIRDPNFLKISLACGKIEQFIEALFPTSNMKALLAQAEVQKNLGVGSKPPKPQDNSPEVFWLLAVSVGAMFFIMALMFFVAYLAGARFDLALAPITEQILGLLSYQTPPSRNGTAAVTSAHKEL